MGVFICKTLNSSTENDAKGSTEYICTRSQKFDPGDMPVNEPSIPTFCDMLRHIQGWPIYDESAVDFWDWIDKFHDYHLPRTRAKETLQNNRRENGLFTEIQTFAELLG